MSLRRYRAFGKFAVARGIAKSPPLNSTIFKVASFEEGLIGSFRTYPVLYDMPSNDYKNEKVKATNEKKLRKKC